MERNFKKESVDGREREKKGGMREHCREPGQTMYHLTFSPKLIPAQHRELDLFGAGLCLYRSC